MFKDWLCFGTNIKVKMCTFIGRVRGRFGAGFLFWNKACLDLCLVVFFISYFFLRSVFSWIFLFVVTKENWSSKSLIWTSETVLFKIGLVGGMSNLLRVSRRAILVWFSDLHVTEWDSDDCRGHSLCPALAGWFFVFFWPEYASWQWYPLLIEVLQMPEYCRVCIEIWDNCETFRTNVRWGQKRQDQWDQMLVETDLRWNLPLDSLNDCQDESMFSRRFISTSLMFVLLAFLWVIWSRIVLWRRKRR